MAAENTKRRRIRKNPKKPGRPADLFMKLKNNAIRPQYMTVPAADRKPVVDAGDFSKNLSID